MNTQHLLRGLCSVAVIVLGLLTLLGISMWIGMHSWISAYFFIGICVGIFLKAYPKLSAGQEAIDTDAGWRSVI